jgi:hypothetical protein
LALFNSLLGYQWSKDNTNISGATNSTYTVTDTQQPGMSSYSVIVSNQFETVTSIVATLTVVTPPSTVIDIAFTYKGTAKTGFAVTGVSSNDFWNAYDMGAGSVTNLKFMNGAESSTGLTVANDGYAFGDSFFDPLMQFDIQSAGGNMIVTLTNLIADSYDFFVYGRGSFDYGDSVFDLSVDSKDYGNLRTTAGPDWQLPIWQEGVQYVVFTNVSVSQGQAVTLAVEPGHSGNALINGLQVAHFGPQVPFFVVPPTNAATLDGFDATFSVAVFGTPPLAYQWLHGNSPVAGATNSAYNIVDAQPGSAGSYSVVVSNQYGSVTSSIVSLSLMPLAIAPQPTNQSVFIGSQATFSVGASGIAPFGYQWLYDGSIVPGATVSNYVIGHVQTTDSGSYSVIVTNTYGSVTSSVAVLFVAASPSSLIDVAFTGSPTNLKAGVAATGLSGIDFWNTMTYQNASSGFGRFWSSYGSLSNLRYVDGTASGAGLTFSGPYAQTYTNGTPDPMYGDYLYGSGTMTLTVTGLNAGTYDLYLYGHGDGDGENTVFQVSVPSLNYGNQATTNGPGWSSTSWQEGLQYVEFTNVSVAAGQTLTIAAEPGATGLACLSGLQIALVGPPALSPAIVTEPADQLVEPGENASYQVVTAGQTPLSYQWLFDGSIITGATNSSYTAAHAQRPNMGSYSVIVSNSYGGIISAAGSLSLYENAGSLMDIAFSSSFVTAKVGFAATGVSTDDYWNTVSTGDFGFGSIFEPSGGVGRLKWVDGTESDTGVEVATTETAVDATNGATDPMYGTYLYSVLGIGPVVVNVTNLTAGVYNFYLYGHGNSNALNTVFYLTVNSESYGSLQTTNGLDWLSPVWEEGVQYVEFTNVAVSDSQVVTIEAQPGSGAYGVLSGLQIQSVDMQTVGALISVQPQGQATLVGQGASFSVGTFGASPLAYQWLFNGSNILGATNSSYTVFNAQPGNGGTYSVAVTNALGSATSAPATLDVILPSITLIDVAFTYQTITSETGPAAAGIATNDFWNTYVLHAESLPNLKFVDGTPSAAGLTVTNDLNAYSDSAADLMMRYYLYNAGNMTITVTNLPDGEYDFYIYGLGLSYSSQYALSIGNETLPPKATSIHAVNQGWFWQSGAQYVEFANVEVTGGQAVVITAEPSDSQYAVLCGLQISEAGLLAIRSQPASQSAIQGATATFTVVPAGAPPFFCQWLFNGAAIPGATNSSYAVTNAQLANAGSYSVVVTNAYGSASSAAATLTVVTPFITGAARNADGTITIRFVSPPNASAEIWTTTSLSPPVVWRPVFTNLNAGPTGAWTFTETNWVDYPEMFYKVSTP